MVRVGSRDLLLISAPPCISHEQLKLETLARVCGTFDAAFARLLWPLAITIIALRYRIPIYIIKTGINT